MNESAARTQPCLNHLVLLELASVMTGDESNSALAQWLVYASR